MTRLSFFFLPGEVSGQTKIVISNDVILIVYRAWDPYASVFAGISRISLDFKRFFPDSDLSAEQK